MKAPFEVLSLLAGIVLAGTLAGAQPLGLPSLPNSARDSSTPERIALGRKLFGDVRFSSNGRVSCASCHDPSNAFSDSPRRTSEGINHLTGTRNAPTLINAVYYARHFWDGRASGLEDQARLPFVNPVEMGLPDYAPVLAIVRTDPQYVSMFRRAYAQAPAQVTMQHVQQAIASFERTIVAGDSPFDRWYFAGESSAMSARAKRGYELFVHKGRCATCHLIERQHALFTDNRFHNVGIGIGIGIERLRGELGRLSGEWDLAQPPDHADASTPEGTLAQPGRGIESDLGDGSARGGGAQTASKRDSGVDSNARAANLDQRLLADPRAAELGRYAVSGRREDIGAFRTPSLRNVALTAPYMHDGSLATLREVVEHFNRGGATTPGRFARQYLSRELRPLGLHDEEIDDIVAFLESLTSPSVAASRHASCPSGAGDVRVSKIVTTLAAESDPHGCPE